MAIIPTKFIWKSRYSEKFLSQRVIIYRSEIRSNDSLELISLE